MQYQGHTLRHELKYYINASVYHTLRNRLRVVLKPDPNMKREDGYLISSLYFDDLHHSALNESSPASGSAKSPGCAAMTAATR